MTQACWPPVGQDITSKATVGTDSPSSFYAQCHCVSWRKGGFDTADSATLALVEHRGETRPEES